MSLKSVRFYSFFLGFCFFLFYISTPHSVSAHATPLSYSLATTTTSTSFSIVFSERIEPQSSALAFVNASGTVYKAQSSVSSNFSTLTASVPSSFSPVLGSWYVVSYDDGHFTRGNYPFITSSSHEMNSAPLIDHSVSLLEVFFIFIELFGQALLLGLCALGLFVFFYPTIYLNPSPLFLRLIKWLFLSFGLSMVGAIALIGYKAYLISSPAHTSFITTIFSLSTTYSGSFVLYRIGAYLCGILLIFFATQRIRYSYLFFFCGFFTFTAIALRAFSSHAVASGFLPAVSGIIMTLHLFSKELWIGMCVVSISFFSDFFSRISLTAQQYFLRFFNIATLFSLLIGGVSGAYVVWLDAKSFEAFFTTAWGRECLTLLIFGGIFLMVRLFNMLVAPRCSARFFSPHPDTHKSILGITLPLEALVGVAILFFSSSIIITSPPVRSLSAPVFTTTPLRIASYSFNPSFIEITVPTDTDALTVEASRLQNGENTLPLTPVRISDTAFLVSIAPLTAFDLLEPWTISTTAHIPKAYDIHAETSILLSALATHRFSFSFTLALLGVATLIILFCVFLFRHLPRPTSSRYSLTLHEDSAWFFWLIIVGIFIFVFLGNHGGHNAILTSSFQRTCMNNGFVWQEAVPFQEGIPDSFGDIALGCSGTHNGHVFHITDFSRYRYFMSSGAMM